MPQFVQILPLALRAAAWRMTPDVPRVRLSVLLAWAVVSVLIGVLLQYVDAGARWRFHPAGLNYAIAANALTLLIAALFVAPRARVAALSALLALGILYALLAQALWALLGSLGIESGDVPAWSPFSIETLVFFVTFIWWAGALVCIVRSAEAPYPAPRPSLRAVALAVVLIAVMIAAPHDYAFRGPDFRLSQSNWWEAIRASWREARNNELARLPKVDSLAERAELRQPALLQDAFGKLAPQRDGRTDVYALGISGWSAQAVFPKERDGALAAFPSSYEIGDRTIRLTNHTDTLFTQPLANRQNVAAAVSAIGRTMNKDEDILLLFMTSHGTKDGFSLYLPDSIDTALTPRQLAAALDAEGIKNRIIIVSSCYSGAFVAPLVNENTIVMTASDENSTSFGCSDDRDWTYFGEALFAGGLTRHTDLERAFDDARTQITEWEARDKIPASSPQAHFGAAITAKLRALTGGRSAEIPVPVARP